MIRRSLLLAGSPATVFDALTVADEVTTWWGDETSYRTIEWLAAPRSGGEWKAKFSSPKGQTFSSSGSYTDVRRPEVLDWTWAADWNPTSVKQISMRLAEDDGGTRMILVSQGHENEQERAEDERGWDQILGWLSDYLSAKHG